MNMRSQAQFQGRLRNRLSNRLVAKTKQFLELLRLSKLTKKRQIAAFVV
jgi:hypothetical protein